MSARAIAGFCAVLLCGCGGGQTRAHPFESPWHDEDGRDLAAFVHGWKMPAPKPPPAVAIGAVDDRTLVGLALATGQRWRYEHELESRPAIAGEVVVGMGGGQLFALAAQGGAPLWHRAALGRLRGAADDGNTTVVSIETLSGTHSVLLAIARSGRVVRQLYEPAVLGAPEVFDSFAFLPFDGHAVVVFDLTEGTEVARIVSSTPVHRAFVVGGSMYFGGVDTVRFDDAVVAARRGGGSRVPLPPRSFPGDPEWHTPVEPAPTLAARRHDTIRYLGRPAPGPDGKPVLGALMLSWVRLAVGLSPTDGATRWVWLGPGPLLGGDAGDGGFALCDRQGTIWLLGVDDGRPRARRSLGERLVACAVQAGGWSVARRRPPPMPLVEQLAGATAAADPALLPMQLVLVDDLGRLPGADATAALLALARRRSDDEHGPAAARLARRAIREQAAARLATRREGREPLLAAISQPGATGSWLDWMHGRRNELPVGAIAAALGAMAGGARDARLAAALAPFVHDPTLAAADRAAATRLLAASAGPAERAVLLAYLVRAACLHLPAASDETTQIVARALLGLGTAEPIVRLVALACTGGASRRGLLALLAAVP